MDAVAQIKQTLDIVDVVSSYVSLKKAGKNYSGACPFHNENTPSFMVSPDLQIYKCFGCNAAGDMFNFVEQIEGVEFIRALEILAEKAGIEIERHDYDPKSKLKKRLYEINQMATKFYAYILTKHKMGKPGLEYLQEKRGLTLETIRTFDLGFAPDTWDTLYKFLAKNSVTPEEMLTAGVVVRRSKGSGYIDKFRGRITFPLTGIDGRPVGFTGRDVIGRDPKYLNSPETPIFYKSSYLYGLAFAKVEIKKKGAIFVEGQMDVISAYQHGIKNVVASSGTSLTENQLRVLARYSKDLIFCFDSDTAGINAVFRAVNLADKQEFNIKVVMVPEPYKDLDELLQESPDQAKRVIRDAVPVYDYFLAAELKKHDKGTARGKKSILNDLQPYFSKISNIVTFDHYVKKVSDTLGLREETVRDVFSTAPKAKGKKKPIEDAVEEASNTLKIPKERYLLSLLLRTELDTMRNFLYKAELETFSDSLVRDILGELSQYSEKAKGPFNIKKFVGNLTEEQNTVVSELYLTSLGENVDEPEEVLRELALVYRTIFLGGVKIKLKEVSEKIKVAEMANDSVGVEELTAQFNKLSQELTKNNAKSEKED
jgi:DNA primase